MIIQEALSQKKVAVIEDQGHQRKIYQEVGGKYTIEISVSDNVAPLSIIKGLDYEQVTDSENVLNLSQDWQVTEIYWRSGRSAAFES